MNLNIILIIISITAFVNPFMISSVNIAIVEIEKSLQTTSNLTSWIINSYMLSTAISLMPSAKLADIYGKRKIFLTGIFIFTIFSFLCGLSKNFNMMIISRIIQGIGGGMFLSTGTAILASVFPKEKRGRVLGINVACVYLGLSLGPFLGGFIVYKYGWSSVFFITAAINLLIFFVGKNKLIFEEILRNEKIDFNGIIFYSVFLFSFIYGISKINTLNGIIIFIISILLLYSVYFIERRSKYSIINIFKLKNNISFIFSNLAALINYTASSAVTFFLSVYLQNIHFMTPQETGKILLIQPLIMSIISPFAGKLSDRKEPQIIASSGMIITTISLLMLCFLNSNSSINYVVIILILAGTGFGLFSSPNTNAVMSSVEKNYYTIASGILATSRVIGQSLSMGIATLFISIFMHGDQFTQNKEAFIKALNFSFLAFFILSFAGIFFSIKRGKIYDNFKS